MGHAADQEVVERARHALDGGGAVLAVGAELGDHRVVEHRDLVAFAHPGVVAHRDGLVVAFRRRLVAHQPADGRQEAAIGVLGIDTALDRPALGLELRLGQRQGLAGGDADHLLDQIDAGDQLGDRMLHLKTGVHLQEIEGFIGPDDELHRAGGVVAHRPRQGDGLGGHGLARRLVQEGRGRFFDDLLVPALDRALPLVQVQHGPVPVAQHLDLDVAG